MQLDLLNVRSSCSNHWCTNCATLFTVYINIFLHLILCTIILQIGGCLFNPMWYSIWVEGRGGGGEIGSHIWMNPTTLFIRLWSNHNKRKMYVCACIYNFTWLMSCTHGSDNRFEKKDSGGRHVVASYWILMWGELSTTHELSDVMFW